MSSISTQYSLDSHLIEELKEKLRRDFVQNKRQYIAVALLTIAMLGAGFAVFFGAPHPLHLHAISEGFLASSAVPAVAFGVLVAKRSKIFDLELDQFCSLCEQMTEDEIVQMLREKPGCLDFLRRSPLAIKISKKKNPRLEKSIVILARPSGLPIVFRTGKPSKDQRSLPEGEMLGEGGFKKVISVKDLISGHQIALGATSRGFSSLVTEYELAQKVHSLPQCVIPMAAGHRPNSVKGYIAFPLISGKSIEAAIRQDSCICTVELILDLVDALAQVHEKGQLHGDFALRNLMLDEQNKLRIIDFGWSDTLNNDNIRRDFEGLFYAIQAIKEHLKLPWQKAKIDEILRKPHTAGSPTEIVRQIHTELQKALAPTVSKS